jgi:hypothetical protein
MERFFFGLKVEALHRENLWNRQQVCQAVKKTFSSTIPSASTPQTEENHLT